jgi:hypothetical protein
MLTQKQIVTNPAANQAVASGDVSPVKDKYTLALHIGTPAVNALEFETNLSYGRKHVGKRNAAELRELAGEFTREAKKHRFWIEAHEKDAAQLLTLAAAMEAQKNGRTS